MGWFGKGRAAAHPAPGPFDLAWLLRHIAFYRGLGFYQGQGSFDEEQEPIGRLDDAGLAARIIEAWGGIPATPGWDPTDYDRFFLATDSDRVWDQDLECDAVSGNGAYVQAIQGWARISRGAFQPESIQEKWGPARKVSGTLAKDPPTDSVTVALTVSGHPHEWVVDHYDDWLNPIFLEDVNGLLASSPIRFCAFPPRDQTMTLIALTAAERATIESARAPGLTNPF